MSDDRQFRPGDRVVILLGSFDPDLHDPWMYEKYNGRAGTLTRGSDTSPTASIDLDAGNGHPAEKDVRCGFAWLYHAEPVPTFNSIDQAEQWLEERAHHE